MGDTFLMTKRIIAQTAKVQEGDTNIQDRVVSLFDPDARPIKRGKLKAPTEFGYKLLLRENEEKVITGYAVFKGNPGDDSLLQPAVTDHIQTFGRPPWGIATDRGFSSPANESALQELGVKRVSLPRKGNSVNPVNNFNHSPGSKDCSAGVRALQPL